MKSYEKESLFKSFILFFPILTLLLTLFYWQNYLNKKEQLNKNILNSMKACSFTLNCKKYTLDIVGKKNQEPVKLYFDKNGIYSLFNIIEAPKYYLKLSLKQDEYKKNLSNIKYKLLKEYIIYLLLLVVIALIFSLYSLYPLKRAIELNDEFVKDILHDVNTPLSSIKINLSILERKYGSISIIDRLKNSLNSIEALQENLRSFLSHSKLQIEKINLKELIETRVKHFKKIYNSNIEVNLPNIYLKTNKVAFDRIISNIIDNACKHNNNSDLKVVIELKNNKLYISDNGKGIEDINKVFQRGYTSSNRGLGLGLSIVQKLSKELNIKINIKSSTNKGTTFILDLSNILKLGN